MHSDAPRILIIDDEILICRNCAKILDREGYLTDHAMDGFAALAMMRQQAYDIVITDLKMSRVGGMEVLERVTADYPDTLVIVITGYASVSSAVEVMKGGAYDYLPKPFTPDELRGIVNQALEERKNRVRNKLLMDRPGNGPVTHQLIGSSPKIRKVISMIAKVAPTDATVLTYGESGTGKELVARAVHANSSRRDRIFFAVDCGTLSGNLLESELFGYRKGAFTGALQDKEGILARAHEGTVFLDEIGNIGMAVQGKLLRFLETRELLPIGATQLRKVDIRLIFATNQDLKELVRQKLFREDFYYRIFVYPIAIPPLRERREDILPIAYHFLKQFAGSTGRPVAGFDNAAADLLAHFDWPGNVRQLRNVIERAVILSEKEYIGVNDLPQINEAGDIGKLFDRAPATNAELKELKKEIRRKAVIQVEKNFLLQALGKAAWNVSQAARQTGIQRTSFQNLMKKHHIHPPRQKEDR